MVDYIANRIYADRYNNVGPAYVRQEWRRRDLLSWFHPYSLMNKAPMLLPSTWFSSMFLVGIAVGFAVRYSHALTAYQFLALQILFLCFIKQPDRSTGEPLVTDILNVVKIMGMWAGWWLYAMI
jgi:hypothetical protein